MNTMPKREKFDKALPLKAGIITTVVLVFLYISVLHLNKLNIEPYALASFTFISNLFIIFVITLIYDYVTARKKFLTQELYGAAFASLAIGIYLASLKFASLISFLEAAILVFVALYAGYWIANRRKILKIVQFFGVLFLIIIVIEAFRFNNSVSSLGSNLNSPHILNSTNTQLTSASQALSTCEVNVQTQLNILKEKLPSGSIIQIVNNTIFYSTGNYPITNVTVNLTSISVGGTYLMPRNNFSNEINNWIQTWSELPYGSGTPTSVNCYSSSYIYYDGGVPYMCADLKTLALKAANTKGFGVGAIGTAVRVQGNYGGASVAISYINPILCDSNGTILPDSLAWLKNIPSNFE